MRRRYFLQLSMALACSGPAIASARAYGPSPLCTGFRDPDAMEALGRRYLELHPEETEPARRWGTELAACGGSIRPQVARQVRTDLDAADVVIVDGWVLPRSLVLTCSAMALDKVG